MGVSHVNSPDRRNPANATQRCFDVDTVEVVPGLNDDFEEDWGRKGKPESFITFAVDSFRTADTHLDERVVEDSCREAFFDVG